MIFPKKPQLLYAPMLATFGGGSANGFKASGASDYGYWGLDYDGWDGSKLDMTESERASNYNITTGDADWTGLQGHLSHYHARVYSAYQNQSYQAFVGANSNYPSPVSNSSVTSYYNMGGTSQFNSNIYNDGRAFTIAYLGDGSPVFVASYDGSNHARKLNFWDAELGSSNYMQHLGSLQMTGSFTNFNFTTNNSVANYDTGEYAHMVYDGSGLIIKCRSGDTAKKQWIKIDLPPDKNIGSGCTAQYRWTMTTNYTHSSYSGSNVGAGYGASYMGMDNSGYRYIYENSFTNSNGGRIVRLTPPTDPSQSSTWDFKTSTLYGGGYGVNGQDWEITTGQYSCLIDYREKKLLTGSHSSSGTWYVFDLF